MTSKASYYRDLRCTINPARRSPAARLSLIVAAFALFSSFHSSEVFAQFQRREAAIPPVVEKRFGVDVLSFAPATMRSDSVRVDVYLAVPYENLSFLYAVDKYVADYAAIVQVTDRANDKLLLDKYQAFTVLETTAQHEMRAEKGIEHADAEQFSFTLQSSHDYDIRVVIRDMSSHHESDTVLPFRTKSFDASRPVLSDILVYRNRTGSRIQPLIGGDLTMLSGEHSGIFATLYNPPVGAVMGVVSEIYALKDGEPYGDPLIREETPVRSSQASASGNTGITGATFSQMPIFQDISFDDLWMGRYRLRTYVLPSVADTSFPSGELAKAAIGYSERTITVRSQRGIPVAAADLEQAIEQLRLIATASEWDSLSAPTNPKQQREAILEFWRKRNPDPGSRYNRPMEVFYARVEYANKAFASGFQPGWRSDRGHVYIVLGEPDFIDKRSYSTENKPYETWEYAALHYRFVFMDAYMLGDFKIAGPFPPPGTFLWDR